MAGKSSKVGTFNCGKAGTRNSSGTPVDGAVTVVGGLVGVPPVGCGAGVPVGVGGAGAWLFAGGGEGGGGGEDADGLPACVPACACVVARDVEPACAWVPVAAGVLVPGMVNGADSSRGGAAVPGVTTAVGAAVRGGATCAGAATPPVVAGMKRCSMPGTAADPVCRWRKRASASRIARDVPLARISSRVGAAPAAIKSFIRSRRDLPPTSTSGGAVRVSVRGCAID